jgi:GntR family transcriptional regulator
MQEIQPTHSTGTAAEKAAALRAPQPLRGHSRYAMLAAALQERIRAGEWAPGEAIPSESSLAQVYGVALGTMRQAMALLVQDGVLQRQHGKGTFVSAGLDGASMMRFFRFGGADRSSPAPQSHILSMKPRAAQAGERQVFGLDMGAQVLHIERLRSIEGEPCLLENIVLPLPLFGRLAETDTSDWPDLLYPFFQSQCGVVVHQAEDHLSFGQLGTAQARRLKLQSGHPCAVVQRRAHDLHGRCVELRTTRGDAFAFEYTAQVR